MNNSVHGVPPPSIYLDLPEQVVSLNVTHRHARNHAVLDTLSFKITSSELVHLPQVEQFLRALPLVRSVEPYFELKPREPLSSEKHKERTVYYISNFLRALSYTSCESLLLRERAQCYFPRCPGATNFQDPVDLRPLTTLKFLFVSMSLLFLPPFRDWMIQSMNGSPLTTVVFMCLLPERKDWSQVLRRLELPHLSQLVLGGTKLHFGTIREFLSRHPNLESLTLLENPKGMKCVLRDPTLLPRLGMLKCPPVTLYYFLGDPMVLPCLEEITLDLPAWTIRTHVRDWNEAIRVISRRKINLRLHLTLILGLEGHPFPPTAPTEVLGVVTDKVDCVTLDVRHSPALLNYVPTYLKLWLTALRNAPYVTIKGQHSGYNSELRMYIYNAFSQIRRLDLLP
ncbi:hypothetical protein NEOLEDRAFT_1244802 [Neolentinus lepideus HHB14362 ss-1]|uniref:F-box domain-containing protein n=1 Tax=Neolentinus lepideus HHB14362 ss-1 TaxID=1314782 RepID=A0A165PIA3_9AGAM|nr:hypothetical protein NEOLEDRAFT_1244802 [Neolentinus lepideus HHB14362 ss-1]